MSDKGKGRSEKKSETAERFETNTNKHHTFTTIGGGVVGSSSNIRRVVLMRPFSAAYAIGSTPSLRERE